jgi:hypothetical protein
VWLSLKAYAQIVGRTPRRIQQLIQEGKLETRWRKGGRGYEVWWDEDEKQLQESKKKLESVWHKYLLEDKLNECLLVTKLLESMDRRELYLARKQQIETQRKKTEIENRMYETTFVEPETIEHFVEKLTAYLLRALQHMGRMEIGRACQTEDDFRIFLGELLSRMQSYTRRLAQEELGIEENGR